MSIYASDTSVSPEKSRMEIERTLQRYRANKFAYASQEKKASIVFEMNDRRIRFDVPLPTPDDFARRKDGGMMPSYQVTQALEKSIRQRWRALALAIKAKLEAVESGITTFEEEFLAHIVLPNGRTYGEWAVPQIAEAYEHKKMPPLLGAGV